MPDDFSTLMLRLRTLPLEGALAPTTGPDDELGRFAAARARLLARGDAEWGADRILHQLALEAGEGSIRRGAEAWPGCDWALLRDVRQTESPRSFGLRLSGRLLPQMPALPDGRLVTVDSRALRFWNPRTGLPESMLELPLNGPVADLARLPSGALIATRCVMTILDWALRYVDRGWSVIPLEPRGKRPLLSWSRYQSSRASTEEVEGCWKRWPEANVGIVTGEISGIVVLDVDGPQGEDSLEGRTLPATSVCVTGRGVHYYFKHPGRQVQNRAGVLPGLDLRGDGGYVVAPPSVHSSGRPYAWASGTSIADLAELPDWILRNEKQHQQGSPSSNTGHRSSGGCPKASGTKPGSPGRPLPESNRGFTATETVELLLLWNTRNQPPLPSDEVVSVVEPLAQREAGRIRS